MYSKKERIKAVLLHIDYYKNWEAVIDELGYPTRRTLSRWHKKYIVELEGGIDKNKKFHHYTQSEREKAVHCYLENNKNASKAVRELGYPHPDTLSKWVDELTPNTKKQPLRRSDRIETREDNKARRLRGHRVNCSKEQKIAAVVAATYRDKSIDLVAEEYGVTRYTLYNWKKSLLGEDQTMDTKSHERELERLRKELTEALEELEDTKKDLSNAKLEVAVLEKTAELIKKDPGINPKHLTNKEKTILIDALTDEHPSSVLIEMMEISRSSYYYQHNALKGPDKYADIRIDIRKAFEESGKSYGYRRIHCKITRSGKTVSEKIVRRIMKEEGFFVYAKKRRSYSSYEGEHNPAAENLIARDFHADNPNEKWLTDITEFRMPDAKVYLSPIVDCFDGMVTSWTISSSPNADLVNTMLDKAISTLNENEFPLVHTDRGGHYRWQGWLTRIEDAKLIRSMSKKGCSPDNAACEGFFGRLKNEMFYNRSWEGVTANEFMAILNDYIIWYNEKRIKMSLGGKSPLEYRRDLGIIA